MELFAGTLFRRISFASALLLAAATAILASIMTGPGYQFLAVWIGGGGSAASSSSYQLNASVAQPFGGTVGAGPHYRMSAGFSQQFPSSGGGASPIVSSLSPGQNLTMTITAPSGSISIFIPSGTFDEVVTVTQRVPVSFAAMTSNIAELRGTQIGVELINDKSLAAQRPLTMTLNYRDSDIAGMREDRLRIAYYIASEGRWVPLESAVDVSANTVTTRQGVFGVIQIVEVVPAAELGAAFVYPNPFRPAIGHTQMRFTQLPENAPVRLFTLAGELVRELTADNTGGVIWDGRNGDGHDVASGVYLVHVRRGSENQTLKIAVQR